MEKRNSLWMIGLPLAAVITWWILPPTTPTGLPKEKGTASSAAEISKKAQDQPRPELASADRSAAAAVAPLTAGTEHRTPWGEYGQAQDERAQTDKTADPAGRSLDPQYSFRRGYAWADAHEVEDWEECDQLDSLFERHGCLAFLDELQG